MELIFGIILIVIIGAAIVFGLKFLCAAIGFLSGPIQLASCIACCAIGFNSIGLTGDEAIKRIIIIAVLIALFAALVYSSDWLYMFFGGLIFAAILCALVFGIGGLDGGFRFIGIMSIVTIVLSAVRTVLIFFGIVW